MKNGLLSRTRKAAHAGVAMLRHDRQGAAEATAGPSPDGGALVWVYAVTTGLWPRWARAEQDAERIGLALSDIAVATRRHPFPDPRFGRTARRMVLNGAYLLDAARSREFAHIVESVIAGHEALRADVTGPWPPYSFADRHDIWQYAPAS